ncbi:hypothetical protein Tco_1132425 [Tanacetum coccineum]|uniref:Uncharacterized protein n=1 Tax=Tanacetum coccineum TaxID=301880 RepID=A0ABQ5JBV8_9ASTR
MKDYGENERDDNSFVNLEDGKDNSESVNKNSESKRSGHSKYSVLPRTIGGFLIKSMEEVVEGGPNYGYTWMGASSGLPLRSLNPKENLGLIDEFYVFERSRPRPKGQKRLGKGVVDSWNVAPVNKKNVIRNFMGKLKFLKDRIRSWLFIHRSNSRGEIYFLKEELRSCDEVNNIHVQENCSNAKIKWAIEGDEKCEVFMDGSGKLLSPQEGQDSSCLSPWFGSLINRPLLLGVMAIFRGSSGACRGFLYLLNLSSVGSLMAKVRRSTESSWAIRLGKLLQR